MDTVVYEFISTLSTAEFRIVDEDDGSLRLDARNNHLSPWYPLGDEHNQPQILMREILCLTRRSKP
jgi:hypothetical protein